MRVLILGSGGREHALAWSISRSPLLTHLLVWPGNPGTAEVAKNVARPLGGPREVAAVARELGVELVVVGPEGPLVDGVADALEAAGVPVFGPMSQAARVEGSKTFAKELMAEAGVSTAEWWAFDSAAEAERHAAKFPKIVVKADGLAAGKGVVVARSPREAGAAVRKLAAGGAKILLEELLEGEEVSLIALCDGERYALLPPVRDHKRVGEGDTGPNTGGMGAFCPVGGLEPREVARWGEEIILPVLGELARRGAPFRGALYAGLMVTREGAKVLEFNCRLGDPETQALVLQLDEDLLPLLDACARGGLETRQLRVREGASVAVVLASSGYPEAPRLGDAIVGLDRPATNAVVFHAGTRRSGAGLVTAGGRVLSVCAQGETLSGAREAAYRAIEQVRFAGMHFRRDIGLR